MPTLRELNCPKDCPRRDAWCHSVCKQHDEYRAEAERLRQERQRETLTIHYEMEKKIHKTESRFK